MCLHTIYVYTFFFIYTLKFSWQFVSQYLNLYAKQKKMLFLYRVFVNALCIVNMLKRHQIIRLSLLTGFNEVVCLSIGLLMNRLCQ